MVQNAHWISGVADSASATTGRTKCSETDLPDDDRTDTVVLILDAAEGTARRGGYTELRIAHLAQETGQSESVIRSHFPTHEDLAIGLIRRYTERLMATLGPPRDPEPLQRLVSVWGSAARTDGQMCLCSLYGAQISVLPSDVANETQASYAAISDWIQQALSCRHSAEHAEAVLASLCGALLTVKSMNRPESFETIAWQLIKPVAKCCQDVTKQ